ncbi:hypothetical protein P3X46_012324, partial [Hevea brasiliensis]
LWPKHSLLPKWSVFRSQVYLIRIGHFSHHLASRILVCSLNESWHILYLVPPPIGLIPIEVTHLNLLAKMYIALGYFA